MRSTKDGQFYVGLTRDLRARLQAHNKGLVSFTKRQVPLELVYWEGCLTARSKSSSFAKPERAMVKYPNGPGGQKQHHKAPA
ncbi:MAG: GIY-YIG nuclease family protein [Verrucomicrobia bacterium]|nr:GIY-YIG nuclease family protein [Verrucomicrobiota bacterium]